MGPRRFDVVGLGDCDVDLYVRMPKLPTHDEKVHGDYLGSFAGGVMGNFCCAAAHLGLRTAIVSVVGEDAFGAQTVASLRDFGVATEGVRVHQDLSTYFSLVHLDASGEKALTLARTPAIFPALGDLDAGLLTAGRLLHIAPFDVTVATEAAAIAAAGGVPVSLDLEPGSVREGFAALRRLLELTTVCIVNEFAVADLFGTDAQAAARQLLAAGPRVVVVTRGARGALVVTAQEVLALPGYPVEVVDTTGAGDCFNAAFLTGWLEGWPLSRAASFACAAGALATRGLGSRSTLPNRDDVNALVAGTAGRTDQESQ